MTLYSEKLAAMRTAFDLKFAEAFSAAPSIYETYATVVGDADHTTVELPFFDAFTFMRPWIGPRQVKNLKAEKLVLREAAYEDTVAVGVREIETDNWGVYAIMIAQMGAQGKALWDRLASEAILSPDKWIDGKDFYSKDRRYGDAKTGSVVANRTTDALSTDSFLAARAAMTSYCGHNGEPLGVIPDVLMVGPALEAAANYIVNADFTLDPTGKVTASNAAKGLARVVVNPRFVGEYANHWRLCAAGGVVKPVVLQKSKEAELVALNQPTDEFVFSEGKALYGTSAYGSAAAAFPHLVYAGIVEAA